MAKYRMYKNGIYGHRYKGYYIVRNDKKNFSILDENGNTHLSDISNYDDCEWTIDKDTASDGDLELMKELYAKEIFQLSSLFVELMQKSNDEGLDEKEKMLYELTEKIRKRKADDKAF